MADYTPVAAQAKPPQQMSLADMLNMANAVQGYQQREATNPLALQQLQYQTQTAGQQARTGAIGLDVLEQQAKERPLLQQFFSDPNNYTTDGQYDSRKALSGVSQIAPLTGPEYLKNLAGTMQAQSSESEAATKAKQATVGLNTDQLKNYVMHQQNSSRNLLNLLSKKEITPKDIEDHVRTTMSNVGAPQAAIDQEVANLPKAGSQTELKAYIAKHASNSLSAQEQLEKLFPAATMESFGATKAPVQLTNEAFTGVKPGSIVGAESRMTPAPAVTTAPTATGETKFMVYPGGANQNVPSPAPSAGTTQAPKTQTPKPATNKMVQDFEKTGGLQRAPDEPFDAYKARAGRLVALPEYSTKQMSLANPESIPNTQKINNNILNLLDKPNVNVGKVADYIAGKTAGITLNSDEQIIQKYLEQRVRQVQSRTNQDQSSVKQAYGSFGNDKDALRTIIYNDAGTLAADALYNRGILNARGSSGKPNLSAIADFEQKFANVAQDPDVMHLIGLVGNKSMSQLTASDKAHFQKYFQGKDLKSLFDKKDQIEKLVGGIK
jgi:thiamine phosphate synthase YjbQ (UPF0047 family)